MIGLPRLHADPDADPGPELPAVPHCDCFDLSPAAAASDQDPEACLESGWRYPLLDLQSADQPVRRSSGWMGFDPPQLSVPAFGTGLRFGVPHPDMSFFSLDVQLLLAPDRHDDGVSTSFWPPPDPPPPFPPPDRPTPHFPTSCFDETSEPGHMLPLVTCEPLAPVEFHAELGLPEPDDALSESGTKLPVMPLLMLLLLPEAEPTLPHNSDLTAGLLPQLLTESI